VNAIGTLELLRMLLHQTRYQRGLGWGHTDGAAHVGESILGNSGIACGHLLEESVALIVCLLFKSLDQSYASATEG
jgi:hypothetical protein